MLFADVDWSGVTINAIFTGFGGAVVWLAGQLDRRRKENRDDHREDEKTTVDRYHELYERQDRDAEACKKDLAALEIKLDAMNDKVLVLTVSVVRAVGWIKYQQGLLKVNNVPHEPWQDDPVAGPAPGTSVHRPPDGLQGTAQGAAP